jgi:hypothetical protein
MLARDDGDGDCESWAQVRALAALCVATSLRAGERVDRVLPARVVQLRMPARAWSVVARWLWLRWRTMREGSLLVPALAWCVGPVGPDARGDGGLRRALLRSCGRRQMRRLGETWPLGRWEREARWPRGAAVSWGEWIRRSRKRCPWRGELADRIAGLRPGP